MTDEQEHRLTRIEVQLENIGDQVRRMASQIESESGTMARAHKNINEQLARITKALFGNGDHGLITDVALLKDQRDTKAWQIKLIWASVTALAVSHLWKGFFK